MNKNTLIKIFSVLMIFAVIISTVGCSIGKDSGTKDGEVGAIDVDDLEPENGTIIYEGTKLNDEGKTEKVTQVIDVEHIDTPMVEQENFLKDEDKKEDFINQEGNGNFGMDEDEVKDVIDNIENWKGFYVYKLVENKSNKTMVCKSVSAKGGDGIYVRANLDAEYGIGPGNCTSIAIYAMADMNKYDTDEALDAAFEKLNVKIEYALTDDPYGEIEDWNSVTTQVVEF
ncbi:MAG: hypothetical protein IJZ57_11195 [Clostridia bacterium]|nr:hypothetical protein [Clostridia bacterium]